MGHHASLVKVRGSERHCQSTRFGCSVLDVLSDSIAKRMDALTAFGLVSVTAMMVCYALEKRSAWFVLAFAACCVLASIYGFLQGAWPFGIVEAVWALVALQRWHVQRPA